MSPHFGDDILSAALSKTPGQKKSNYRLVIHSFNKYVYVGALTNQSGFTV